MTRKIPAPKPVPLSSIAESRFGNLAFRDIPLPKRRFGASVIHVARPPRSKTGSIVHDRTEEFIFVLRGSAVAELQGRRRVLREKDSLYIPAGVWHGFESLGRGVEILCVFSPSLDLKHPDVRHNGGKNNDEAKT